MGKMICDSTAASAVVLWHDPAVTPSTDLVDRMPALTLPAPEITSGDGAWENVHGFEDQQKRNLVRLYTKGVLWKHPQNKNMNIVFRLMHGGEVEGDGNCLFTAALRSMGLNITARELRARTVKRFVEDLESADRSTKELIETAIRHMYSPDLKTGWGIHLVQEVKLLAKKQDRESLDAAINELVEIGILREMAAESIYKEQCKAVEDGPSWANYMSISGSTDDDFNIISMQYTEDGLLTVDENRDGHAAAFGDDIAIECLATEFKREIFVVQAHGSDAMIDDENCIFFLPHRPRSEVCEPPIFMFMKGTGWCGAGADHYEPLLAYRSPAVSQDKVAFVL